MAPNPAFPYPRSFSPSPKPATPRDDQGTEDLSPASVVAANAAALHATLSALVPLPFPKAIIPSKLIPGGVMLQWVTKDGSEHELVAHLDSRPVARMAFDLGEPFEVAVDSDGPSDRTYPPARLGDLRRFKTFEPMAVEDEDRLYEEVEWVAKGLAGDGTGLNWLDADDRPDVPREADGCPRGDGCCRAGGKAHQDHAEWPVSAPVSMAFAENPVPAMSDTPPIFAALSATRPRRVSTAAPFARQTVKAAVPILVWLAIGRYLLAIIEAILKASDQAESGQLMPAED